MSIRATSANQRPNQLLDSTPTPPSRGDRVAAIMQALILPIIGALAGGLIGHFGMDHLDNQIVRDCMVGATSAVTLRTTLRAFFASYLTSDTKERASIIKLAAYQLLILGSFFSGLTWSRSGWYALGMGLVSIAVHYKFDAEFRHKLKKAFSCTQEATEDRAEDMRRQHAVDSTAPPA